ncbi:unnamed protein product, partial [Mesorhabditis belari]|uniref:Protein CIP2A n=1 Tax=Mesorhabditis belari TaxID=2138241 RepID=A0AAF3ERI6_9BILA
MGTDGFDIEVDIRRAAGAATRFYGDPTTENCYRFEDTLKLLVSATNSVHRVSRLRLNPSTSLSELLPLCPILLTNSTSGAKTRNLIVQFLYNLGIHNVSLRRHMCSALELCAAVWQALKVSVQEENGPDVLLDLLKLLQVLTYEKCLILGLWANDLISFLIADVIKEPEAEWLPFSTAILCNLTTRSKSAGMRIRKSSNYKPFSKRLIRLLQHDSRLVVVSCLVLIGYLEEKIRDVVYSPANLSMTFQCVFNVLVLGDAPLTRHVACDLLRRMVISEAPTISSQPVITATGRDLVCYSHFNACIQKVAGLLLSVDPLLEETSKILELLISLCSLSSVRSPICQAILHWKGSSGELRTPIIAIAKTGCLPFNEAIDSLTPIRALQLLNYLLKEAVDGGQPVADYIPCERLMQILEENVKTTIDTGSDLVGKQCERICEALRMAEVLSGDDEIRASLLAVTSSQLCSHLAETQLMTNPIAVQMHKPPQSRNEILPIWSEHGASIILELLRLLAALKDTSKAHKDQYWRSLRDERLVPFLGFALTNGRHEQVYNALVVLNHCAQVHDFPTRRLADMIASNIIEKRLKENPLSSSASLNTSNEARRSTETEVIFEPINQELNGKNVRKVLDDVLDRLRRDFDHGALKQSDVVAVYEGKIAQMLRKEKELEALLVSKEQALSQSERLRITTKSTSLSNENEISKMRTLITENERLVDEKMKTEKELFDALTAKDLLVEENRREVDLSGQLRQAAKEMKEKFERASTLALEKQQRCEELLEEKKVLTADLAESRQQSATLSVNKDNEIDELKKSLSETRKRAVFSEEELHACKEKLTRAVGDENQKEEEMRRNFEIERVQYQKDFSAMKNRLEAEKKEMQERLSLVEAECEKTRQEIERVKRIREEMLKLAGNF